MQPHVAVATVIDRNNITSWLLAAIAQLDGGVGVGVGQPPAGFSFLCASPALYVTVTGVPTLQGGVTGGLTIVPTVSWIIS